MNGEPYYSGYVDARGLNGGYRFGAPGGTEKDDQFVRSAIYGNFLSGGFGGHVYGAEGIWGADIEPAAPIKMWDAFQWNSAAQMQYLRTFALSIGKRYQELVPIADLVSPNKTRSAARTKAGPTARARPTKKSSWCISRRAAPAARSAARSYPACIARNGSTRATERGRMRAAEAAVQRDRHHPAAGVPGGHRLGAASDLRGPGARANSGAASASESFGVR